MNCTICNTPLATNARFCPTCGTPVSAAANPAPSYQNIPVDEPFNKQEPPTILPGYLPGKQPPQPSWSQPSSTPQPPQAQSSWPQPPSVPQPQPSWSQPPSAPQPQPSYYQSDRPGSGGNMFACTEEDVKLLRR